MPRPLAVFQPVLDVLGVEADAAAFAAPSEKRNY
jgi:hypothetical protein